MTNRNKSDLVKAAVSLT